MRLIQFGKTAATAVALTLCPIILAVIVLKLWKYGIHVPFYYDNSDATWQLGLTKVVLDTGWVLVNPFMGAPGIANWYANPAAQTSGLHSVLLILIGKLTGQDAATTQNIYYVLNFSLITLASYVSCRLLGISRFLAICAGILFAFLPARFNFIAYSYLSNFFTIPLAIVPSIWVMAGAFSNGFPRGSQNQPGYVGSIRHYLSAFMRSKMFWFCVFSEVLIATADGYYAFFSLLLLGFSTAVRFLLIDAKKAMFAAAPAVMILALMGTALVITQPLREYQKSHPEQFATDGIPDPAYTHSPAEALVYSTSFMVLISPVYYHRIPVFARLGNTILGTSNAARLWPTNQLVPLGVIGTFMLLYLIGRTTRSVLRASGPSPLAGADTSASVEIDGMLNSISVLSAFVLGCSVFGGIGALIALAYPTIRAYERFPIFLSFLLLCAAGLIVTKLLEGRRPLTRLLAHGGVGIVTLIGVLDQTPHDFLARFRHRSDGYLADQKFIAGVEQKLPQHAMVFQYPYSNYLFNSPYYGWGSFADQRFYLHSHTLRWSAGAAKNTPVDIWQRNLSMLPIEQQVTEAEAAGFQGFLVDRTVLTPADYSVLKERIVRMLGTQPDEDAASNLAFWRLPDAGYRVSYDPKDMEATKVTVTDPSATLSKPISRVLRRAALAKAIDADGKQSPASFDKARFPALFADTLLLNQGLGNTSISEGPGFKGGLSCSSDPGRPLSPGKDTLPLEITNDSAFDWVLNSAGSRPLRIGLMEVLSHDGTRLRWDGGYRVPGPLTVAAGTHATADIALKNLDLTTGIPASEKNLTLVFALVQDGNAWFNAPGGHSECRAVVERQ